MRISLRRRLGSDDVNVHYDCDREPVIPTSLTDGVITDASPKIDIGETDTINGFTFNRLYVYSQITAGNEVVLQCDYIGQGIH